MSRFVVFRLDDRRYAVPVGVVERVVRAVEVTVLPKAPEIVLGVIDAGGRILPVLNTRRRAGLPDQEIGLSDAFLVAQTGRRTVVLVVNEVEGLIECPTTAITARAKIAPGLEQIRGMIKLEDGLALIYNLEEFLSLEETDVLEVAMCQEGANER